MRAETVTSNPVGFMALRPARPNYLVISPAGSHIYFRLKVRSGAQLPAFLAGAARSGWKQSRRSVRKNQTCLWHDGPMALTADADKKVETLGRLANGLCRVRRDTPRLDLLTSLREDRKWGTSGH